MRIFIKKIVMLLCTLLLVSIFTFFLFSIVPGDAAIAKLGKDASPERVEELRNEMGLNEPVFVQYISWLKGAVRMDFGESYQYKGNDVSALMRERLPATLVLAGIALLLILLVSLPLGVLGARHRGQALSGVIQILTRITMAIPPFFLGMLLTYLFGVILRWFQPGSFVGFRNHFWGSVSYLIFPALAVALPKVAMMVRFLQRSIEGEMDKDYVRTAYSKGNTERQVFYGHILKNALIPVVTFAAIVAADLIAGSLIVEQVFSVPGIGQLLVSAISNRDYPVVQAIVLCIAGIVVIMNTIVDLLYYRLDPRLRRPVQQLRERTVEEKEGVHES